MHGPSGEQAVDQSGPGLGVFPGRFVDGADYRCGSPGLVKAVSGERRKSSLLFGGVG